MIPGAAYDEAFLNEPGPLTHTHSHYHSLRTRPDLNTRSHSHQHRHRRVVRRRNWKLHSIAAHLHRHPVEGSDIRRALRMTDREREDYYFASNRNVLRLLAAAKKP